MSCPQDGARVNEWFVPSFGPLRFRVAIGLLFLPYTGMVLAFTVVGSMLAETIHWDRVAAILAIYFLALGIAAHALDAVGSRGTKPWGVVFSRRQLFLFAASSLVLAYAIGIYYMLRDAPMLWWIALSEGFFLLAYNLEWFGGRFHTDGWFALSWGGLPVLAGYVLQTNRLSWTAVLIAAAAALLAVVEIKASRPLQDSQTDCRHQGAVHHGANVRAAIRVDSQGSEPGSDPARRRPRGLALGWLKNARNGLVLRHLVRRLLEVHP